MDDSAAEPNGSAEVAWRLVRFLHSGVATKVEAMLVLRGALIAGEELTAQNVTELLSVPTRTAQRYLNDLHRSERQVSAQRVWHGYVYRWGDTRPLPPEDEEPPTL